MIKIFVPPIKCQGIKTKLVPLILASAGKITNGKWIEPFMGSCVVGLNARCKRALFADQNPHLVNFYAALQSRNITPESVRLFLESEGSQLEKLGEKHYYDIRARFNEKDNPLDFLFLSRACFNGLMRFNSKGKFNVPFCRKPERFAKAYITKIVNQIIQFQEALRHFHWDFVCNDFETTIAQATENDFI
jgi:DNA adenine methylase